MVWTSTKHCMVGQSTNMKNMISDQMHQELCSVIVKNSRKIGITRDESTSEENKLQYLDGSSLLTGRLSSLLSQQLSALTSELSFVHIA